jgi:hypothetical protein
MDTRHLVWIGALVGSWLGGMVPGLWGSGMLSFGGVFFSMIGGLIGVYVGYRIGQ